MQRKKVLYVPDLQLREGVPINHLLWLAYYALDKGPNRIVWSGDIFDMPSLSSYDAKGSRSHEGRRIRKDVDAGHRGMELVHNIWAREGWVPDEHVTMGNHEYRWNRALEAEPDKLEGMFANDDPYNLERYGIKVHPFLHVVELDGIRYSHFFPHNAQGNIVQDKRGAPTALAQVQRQLASATAGHQQGLSVGMMTTEKGLARGLIAGSFYLHNEPYIKGSQNYWRGIILKHDVYRGSYGLCEVSMSFLERKYRRLEPPGRKVL